MTPFVLPASTVTTAIAGALATLIVWALHQWGHTDMDAITQGALTTVLSVLACHFTTDKPTTTLVTPPATVTVTEAPKP